MRRLTTPPFGHLQHAVDCYFIRHGESEANSAGRIQGRSESKLNERGLFQAQESGRWFAQLGALDAIYSSPLARAYSTAECIGAGVGVAIQRDHALVELDTGIFSDLSAQEAQERYPTEWERFQRESWEGVPRAERVVSLAARAARYWGQLIDSINERAYQRVLSVTHGGMMQWLFKCSVGAEARWMPLVPAANCGIFQLHIRPAPPHSYYAAWKRVNFVAYDMEHYGAATPTGL